MITWNSTYSVGNEKMDKQHQQLFGLIAVLQKCRNSNDRSFLKRIMNTLNDYIVVHFQDEEKLMAKVSFPELASHRKQHQVFVRKIHEFEAEFGRGKDISDQMMEFLKLWLANHILIYDKAYEEYFHQMSDKKVGSADNLE